MNMRQKSVIVAKAAANGRLYGKSRRASSLAQALDAALELESWPLLLLPEAGEDAVGAYFCTNLDEVRAGADILFNFSQF